MSIKERIAYEKDCEHGLDHLFFPMLASYRTSLFEENKEMIEDVLKNLHHEKVDILTLDQGTACWHMGRKFSLTSSQASQSFRVAFVIYQNDQKWIKIAIYLYGDEYNRCEFEMFYFLLQRHGLNRT